jgi:hypothetical protein
MAQDYDKIFKENIEDIVLSLAEKILHIHPERIEEIPDDLQRTIERKPDFLKKITTKKPANTYILHIEFQKEDEPKMAYRMLEYYGMLLRKYELDVHQVVFYISKNKPTMVTHLQYQNLSFSYKLLDLQEVDYHIFLNSNQPEEIILAILGSFGKETPQKVVENILNKLKTIKIETLRREKCVKQLEILSNLRGLQQEIIKQLTNMALIYDLKTDLRYQQGKEEGKIEGKVEATKELQHQMIKRLLKKNILSIQEIAELVQVDVATVKAIAQSLDK